MTDMNSQSHYNPALYLRENAERFPDKPALFFPKGVKNGKVVYHQMTYREMDLESDKSAYALRQAGFGAGDKTVFMLKVGPELFVHVFGLLKVGAMPVVVDPGMGIRRMLHCYKSVEAKTFVGIPIATLVRVIARRMFAPIRAAVTVFKGSIWGQRRLLRDVDTTKPFPIYNADKETPALISFTTGSTGPAKPVECTQGMAQAMMEEMQSHANITADDVQLLTLPFFGLLGMMMGNTCVLPEMDPTKPAEIVPQYLIQAIEQFNVSCMFGSPSLLNALGRYGAQNNVKLSNLRMVSCGGAPMTLDTMKLFRSVLNDNAVFETTWGATEGLPLTSINIDTLLGDAKEDMDSGRGVCIGEAVGRVKVRSIKISHDPIEQWSGDLLVDDGEIGELIVSGPNISPRYHNDPKSDRDHKIHDGDTVWHRTGDLGWFDANKRVWFCGRMSHLVVLEDSKETLYSVQGEGVANSHPSVYRSALTSAQHNDKKIAVMCIELTPETEDDEKNRIKQELQQHMRKFPATQRVEEVLFHPSFPVDIRHNAKIDRHLLGEWATQELTKVGAHA